MWALRKLKHGSSGFTLIELGIVIGVMAILATVVLMGKGFIESAKQTKAMQTINSLISASRTYAKQANGGVSYTGVTIGAMATANILPSATVENPWNLTCTCAGAAAPCDSDCGTAGVCVASPAPEEVTVYICVPDGTVQGEMASAFDASGTTGGVGPSWFFSLTVN